MTGVIDFDLDIAWFIFPIEGLYKEEEHSLSGNGTNTAGIAFCR